MHERMSCTDWGVDVQALIPGQSLPLLITPQQERAPLMANFAALSDLVGARLEQAGGLLFRGFDVNGIDEFQGFAAAFGHPLLSYEFGSTPRSKVSSGVYTSTEYPKHQHIPLHNEQAYTREWPMRIWFYCAQAATVGGATPIADSREVYRRIDARLREHLVRRGLRYVRNFGNGLDVAWEDVFGSTDKAYVEAYCRNHGVTCEWKEDGELRTSQVCQVTAVHPRTGDNVWFNQAHLFHVSNLPAEVRASLLEVVEPHDLPRNVYYADGSPIEDSLLDEVRGVLAEQEISFPWQNGDILMLDNMLTAHARHPFEGPRKVVVAMAQGHRAD